MLTLQVKPRDGKQSPQEMRKSGLVPAVFYGPKEQTTSVAIDARSLEHVWKVAGQTSVVTLAGVGEEKDTLIKDIQVHPVTGTVQHVDFYVLEKGKKVKLSIPLEFVGVAPAEKAGNIVVKALHEIEIEVAPAELPHKLEVDLTSLASVGDHISVSQIKLPASATLITAGDDIVASVTQFIEEKIETGAPAPVEVAEVIGEKPAEEPAPAKE
ncbi:MAG TPA: 50S ribosomal protein L25 [Candidatus Paceibacterota bacterium]|nr:50S ribosomal protein L25 [Candidatus Paceibacterota bacterium]